MNTDNNINIGTKYLSVLLEKYKNVEVAVAAYNAGIGTVDKWIEQGTIKADGTDIENVPYKETNNYVRKIFSKLQNVQGIILLNINKCCTAKWTNCIAKN